MSSEKHIEIFIFTYTTTVYTTGTKSLKSYHT